MQLVTELMKNSYAHVKNNPRNANAPAGTRRYGSNMHLSVDTAGRFELRHATPGNQFSQSRRSLFHSPLRRSHSLSSVQSLTPLYHVTTLGRLDAIRKEGLLPRAGGSGMARLGLAGENLDRRHWVERSRGKVHVAPRQGSGTFQLSAVMHRFGTNTPFFQGDQMVTLGYDEPLHRSRSYRGDPDFSGGLTTQRPIHPNRLFVRFDDNRRIRQRPLTEVDSRSLEIPGKQYSRSPHFSPGEKNSKNEGLFLSRVRANTLRTDHTDSALEKRARSSSF